MKGWKARKLSEIPGVRLPTKEQILSQSSVLQIKNEAKAYIENEEVSLVADPVVQYMNKKQLDTLLKDTKKKMHKAAKDLDFLEAARLRDEMIALEKMVKEKFG